MTTEDVVGAIDELSRCVEEAAHAITPVAVPGHDAAGGIVASLTEAVMGVTAGLVRIAEAIDGLAAAVRESREAAAE